MAIGVVATVRRNHGFLAGQRAVRALQRIGLELELLVLRTRLQRYRVGEVPFELERGGPEFVHGALRAQADLRQRPRGRVGDIDVAVRDHRQAAVAAEVEAVAVYVGAIEQQRRLYGVVVIGLRIADQRMQPQRIGELVTAIQRDVREVGAQLVEARLGADIHVVEHAVHDSVRPVDRCIDHVDVVHGGRAVGAEDRRFEKDLAALGVESRKQRVEADHRGLGDLPLQRTGQAEPFLLMLVDVVARNTRAERVVQRGQRRRARCSRRSGTELGARVTRAIGVPRILPAHGARAFIEQLALGVCGRYQRTELAIRERIADQQRAARIQVFADVVVAALHAGDYGETVVVERPRRAQVDGRTERSFFDLGGRRLANRDCVEQLGRERVEVERAVAIGAAGRIGAAVGAHRFHAVDAHARELRTEAAHADLPALAAVAGDRHARHALDGFGDVQIGKVGDVFGDDCVDGAGRLALRVERDAQALAKARDHDLFERFLRRRRLRPSSSGCRTRNHTKNCLHRRAKRTAIAI